VPDKLRRNGADKAEWGSSGKDARMLHKFRRLLGKTKDGDKQILLSIARKMARKRGA
jgi:hypothetical protein